MLISEAGSGTYFLYLMNFIEKLQLSAFSYSLFACLAFMAYETPITASANPSVAKANSCFGALRTA